MKGELDQTIMYFSVLLMFFVLLVKGPTSIYPKWEYGQGVPDNGASASKTHREIDRYDPGRPTVNNYRMLVSGVVPRRLEKSFAV